MTRFDTLHLERSGQIARIELRRPEKRNAMNPRMASELADVLDQLESDADVRVVSLRGAGGDFCSGG